MQNFKTKTVLASALSVTLLAACGGGGGGGSADDGGGVMLGDDARRAVLADLGSDVILPRLRAAADAVAPLPAAVDALAAAPASATARTAAQDAWRDAADAVEFTDVFILGPAAPSDQPGGEDRRDRVYAYPLRNLCVIDNAAYNGDTVDATTRADAGGLGALEYLLFETGSNPDCPAPDGVDGPQARADYAASVAAFVAEQAQALSNRWEPAEGNFLAQWSTAGAGSTVYSTPQDALDALSTALFYVEKETKDRKLACPTGIGATGLVCTGNDVTRVEFPFARNSTPALRNNLQAFRDAFTGVGGGMGINDLLRGIDRGDIATRLINEVDAAIAQIDNEIDPSYEAEVEAISDSTACMHASQNATGEPAACTLHGLAQRALNTFRTEVVSALSLATPDRAAGDND